MDATTSVELVIGADGTVGAALLRRLRTLNRPALGTSRRPERDRSCCFLDISNPPDQWNGPRVSVAYICAAVARLDACKRDPVGSAQVNVTGTERIAQIMAAHGAFVIYLSTNQVFDGKVPYRRPHETTCPISEYGRQKAEAEKRVLALGDGASVIRLSKVLTSQVALFDGWVTALRRGQQIRPYSDLAMSPTPLETVAEVIAAVGERRWAGIHQLSGNRDVIYADICMALASRMSASPALVAPTAARVADPSAEPPARYTTLDLEGLPEILNVEIPDVESTIDLAVETSLQSMRLLAAG